MPCGYKWERGGMADAADLKSAAARREGSSPSAPTNQLIGEQGFIKLGEARGLRARTDEVEFRPVG